MLVILAHARSEPLLFLSLIRIFLGDLPQELFDMVRDDLHILLVFFPVTTPSSGVVDLQLRVILIHIRLVLLQLKLILLLLADVPLVRIHRITFESAELVLLQVLEGAVWVL